MLPTLNSEAPSWAEISTTVNVTGGASIQMPDYEGIKWESSVARGEVRGASGGRVMKRTTGELSNSASATMLQSGLRDFKRALLTVAPKDSAGRPVLSKVPFDVIIKHSVDDDPEIYITKLLGCRLDKTAGDHAVGTDANKVEIDLNPIEIVEVIDGQDTVLL